MQMFNFFVLNYHDSKNIKKIHHHIYNRFNYINNINNDFFLHYHEHKFLLINQKIKKKKKKKKKKN